MRIGMMADLYKPHISGVTNCIALSKMYFEQWGHDVYVFTFGDIDYVDDEKNVIRSPGLPILDTGYHFSLMYNRKAQDLLQTMDIVHVHHPFVSGSLALRYCRSKGIPIVFTNHTRYDLYAQAYLPILPGVISETALEAYLPTFCRSCDLVVAPSRGIKNVLMRFGVEANIEVIPNGVDIRPFRQKYDPIDRSQFGFSPADVILIYTGRLGPEKNLPFLLRSFAGVAHAYENVGLIIVGDGPERDNLQDRIKHMKIESKVHLTGMVPYEDIPRYLNLADAFITASVTEVHPLSVIEALASGLPTLGIDSPGIGDTIIDGFNGYLVPEEDLATFTAKLMRLVTDREKRAEMGEAAVKYAEQYAIENSSKKMLEKYQEILDGARQQRRNARWKFLRVFQRGNEY